MSEILISVNAGSSSLKCSVFELEGLAQIARIHVDRLGEGAVARLSREGKEDVVLPLETPTLKGAVDATIQLLRKVPETDNLNNVVGVGHRVVQGGDLFSGSVLMDEENYEKILSLVPLAPLHNPANLTCYSEFAKLLPDSVGEVAVFDTGLFHSLPDEERTLPIPHELAEQYSVYRYGAHGISHSYLIGEARRILGEKRTRRTITMHIGSGCSLSAFLDGECRATSMGLTPLGGTIMGTRTGDLDPSVATYLAERMKLTPGETTYMLTKRGGLLGISGLSNDCRDLVEAADAGNERADLALRIFTSRICDFIGSYTIKLGGLDTLVFAGGVYEKSKRLRKALAERIEPALGFRLDAERNGVIDPAVGGVISTDDSPITGIVIPTREEMMIAYETARILGLDGRIRWD